jgi:deoxycytidylate deaminase
MNYKQLAIKLAKTVKGRYRVAAIVLDKRDRVLSTGTNSYTRSHPEQARYGKACGFSERIYLHAEISALIKCKKQGYKIYVARIDIHGNTLLSKPCELCSMAIKEHGIKVIEYTL